ncbi:MAG: nucleotidyltransferase family protein [Candidatus Diapherotrites archaeon]|uniref:Nucleotidyltransferase family protein n=1 Tax=Candidatus Iainarchaeum sp. TaxID=3101447 RepID=A0A8T3YKT0_9ARCH|nr:nucleotidyltransferase family protein [Candidatus Diapherotrites archaeon]
MQSIILAGGRGTRLAPITDVVPKCLVEIKGRPMLEWILEKIIAAGINEVNLIVGYKREMIEEHFGPEFEGVKINYFLQKEQLGTAHAVSLCERHMKGDFLLANGDVIIGTREYEKLTRARTKRPCGIVLARKVSDPSRFGVLKVSGAEVVDIIEKPRPGKEPGNIVSTGTYMLGKDIFGSVRQTSPSKRNEFEIVDSLLNYIATGKSIEYRMCKGPIVDISSFEDLVAANNLPEKEFPQ